MKKLMLAAVAALAAGVAMAYDSRNWTGKGDGTSWFDPNNWQGNKVPSAAERAIIPSGDDLTINLNTNTIVDVYDLYMGNAGTRNITLNGDKGAVLRASKPDDSYWSYITTPTGGTFNLNVPFVALSNMNWAFYSQKNCVVTFGVAQTNTSEKADAQSSFAGGHVNFGKDTGFSSPKYGFLWASGNYDKGYTNSLTLTDNAFIDVKSFTVGSYYQTSSSRILLDGADVWLKTDDYFLLGSSYTSYQFTEMDHEMIVRGATVTVGGNFTLANTCPAKYVQESGTTTIGGGFTFANNSASGGALEVLGGSFMVGGQMACNNLKTKYTMTLKDCTFGVGKNSDITVPLYLAGTVTIDVPEGVSLKLMNVTTAPGTTLVKTGTGSVTIDLVDGASFDLGDTPLTFVDMTVGAGNDCDFELASGTLNITRNFSIGTDAAGSHGSATLGEGATLSVFNMLNCRDDFTFSMKNGATFAVGATATMNCNLLLEGTNTFDVAEGATLEIKGPIDMATNVVLRKTGAGTLTINHDLVWRGDVDIVAGTLAFADRHTYENADGDESVRKMYIRDAGRFLFSYSAEITSPRDLYTEGNGHIYMNDRSIFPVRHLYTNGVKVARGAIRPSETGISRYDGVIAIPWIWTGKGNGTSWTDKKNWEDETLPGSGPIVISTDSVSRMCYCDFSAATNVIQDYSSGNVITFRGFIFNPNSGSRKLVLSAKAKTGANNRNAYRFNCEQYQASCFVGKGREVIFDDVQIWQEGSQNWGFHGSGTYRIRGDNNLFFTTAASGYHAFHTKNMMPVSTIVYEYLTNTVEQATLDFQFHGLGDRDRFSDIVIGEGAKFYVKDLVWAEKGFSSHRWTHQKAGYFSPDRIFMTNVSESRGTATYYLEGGELDVRTALYVGSMYLDHADYSQYPYNNFQMTGGILRTPLIGCENNHNYIYLFGGEAYVGAGGVTLTDSTGRKNGKRTFIQNTTPALQLGNATVHAAANFDVELETEVTGNAKLDTGAFGVTFTNTVEGAGTLEITGGGKVAFNAAVSGISIKVDASTTLEVAEGVSAHVKALVVGGVRQTGTYKAGDGEIVIDGGEDWLADAPFSANATANCADDKTLDALSYSCLVSDAGRLTIAGAGSLAFNANAEIYVRAGDTLVLGVPMTAAGAITFTGGGTVVISNTFRTASGVASAVATIAGGTCVKVMGEVNEETATSNAPGIIFKTYSDGSAAQLSKLVIAEGGVCNYFGDGFFPTVGPDRTRTIGGGIVEVTDGGLLYLMRGDGTVIGGGKDRKEILRLDGGTLKIMGRLMRSGDVGDVTIELKRGTLEAGDALYDTLIPDFATGLEGELIVKIPSGVNASLKAQLTGAGTIRKTGAGTLSLYGDLSGVTGVTADEGTLILTEASAKTVNVIDMVRLDPASLLGLDFVGALDVTALYVGGKQRIKGVYGEGVAPKPKKQAPIIGDGFLNVLTGDPHGMVIIIK